MTRHVLWALLRSASSLLCVPVAAQDFAAPRLLYVGALPTAEAGNLLRIDRRAPAAQAAHAIEAARSAGAVRVHFAASLPDGRPGSFLLTLPEGDQEAAVDLVLRLSFDRPGVPPHSVTPVLARLQHGLGPDGLQLAIEVPGDARFEPVLQVLAAVADAGVSRAVVRWGNHAGPARDGALAMDLGPAPALQVRPVALPGGSPRLVAGEVGFTAAPLPHGTKAEDGGAGGRFGGRGRGRGLDAEALAASMRWVVAAQRPDGSWAAADDGAASPADVEATALMVLAFHGDGQTMHMGASPATVARAVGWLLSQQEADGRIGAEAKGAVRRHAIATYALAEASGLAGPRGVMLRGALGDAIGWLVARRKGDGGFGDLAPGAVSTTDTTAWAHMALYSAAFFGLDVGIAGDELVAFFDRTDRDSAAAGEAAELFCRFFAGQDPKVTGRMQDLATRLLAADVQGPEAVYWSTYALFQMGGRFWQTWSPRLGRIAASQQQAGEHAGSWTPEGGRGRAVTTALHMLTIEAYYRYTRLVR